MIRPVRQFAWLVLAVAVAFIGAPFVDRCVDGVAGDCPPACHLSCADGCGVSLVEPSAPAPAALERTRPRHAEIAAPLLELDFPPERFPPRA